MKSLPNIDDLNRKTDLLAKMVSMMQMDIQAKNRLLDNLDLKSRGRNLLVDGLPELYNEDTINHVTGFLSKFVPHFERHMIDNAFRIGKSQNRSPRRIMLRVSSSPVRDAILNCADMITQAGSPGVRVFINEDLPESIKRRRSDIYKYVCFLKEKGINAVQRGDGVFFNDTFYHFDEILNMTDGFTLKDSRTKYQNGVLAFQSQFSPLSNLYLSPIKRNGIVFRSAEHDYQYVKAISTNELALARSILNEPCPYEAMATGKKVPLTPEWQSIQLGVMEEILRLKAEQVPAFAKELRASSNHHIVENTRSPFWGAGTYYNAPSIFTRTYPGRNNLGKLLEKVCDNF